MQSLRLYIFLLWTFAQEQQFLDRYISSLSQSAIESKGLNDETTARTFINNLINDIKS